MARLSLIFAVIFAVMAILANGGYDPQREAAYEKLRQMEDPVKNLREARKRWISILRG